MISELKLFVSDWIGVVAKAIDGVLARFARRRKVSLIEGDDGLFSAKAEPVKNRPDLADASFHVSDPQTSLSDDWKATLRGCNLEISLKPDGVLFRPLDFPKQASEFLDGMIRAQLDRLTPWSARDAAFGWGEPTDIGNERIQINLAAMPRTRLEPFTVFAGHVGAAALTVLARPVDEAGSAPVKMFHAQLGNGTGRFDTARVLRFALLGSGLVAAMSLLASAYFGNALQIEQQDLSQRIAQRRAALRIGQSAAGGSAQGLLAKRKQSIPASVMVLEAMSRSLPDNTYVTELRFEGEKVQVVGTSQDAPSLIRLIERSPQFSHATFFAPTTRAHGDPGERFHIEAHVAPYFGSGS